MAWKFYDTNGNLKTTGSGGGGAAVAYENEVNIFTELNEFKDIEFTDQDATPVAPAGAAQERRGRGGLPAGRQDRSGEPGDGRQPRGALPGLPGADAAAAPDG